MASGQNYIIPLRLDPYVPRLNHDITVNLQRSCVLKMRPLTIPATCLPGLQILNNPCQDYLMTNFSPRSYKYLSLSSPSSDSLHGSPALDYLLLQQTKSTYVFFYYRYLPGGFWTMSFNKSRSYQDLSETLATVELDSY